MTKQETKNKMLDYFKDHYKHFEGYPMECTLYDEDEETTYSFEECMKLISKELGK